MDQEVFIADAWEVVGRKVSKERFLTDIYLTAKSSVGLPIAQDSDAAKMFRLVLGEGRSLIARRRRLAVQFDQHVVLPSRASPMTDRTMKSADRRGYAIIRDGTSDGFLRL